MRDIPDPVLDLIEPDEGYLAVVITMKGNLFWAGLLRGFSVLAVFLGTLLIAHRRRQRSAIGNDLPTLD